MPLCKVCRIIIDHGSMEAHVRAKHHVTLPEYYRMRVSDGRMPIRGQKFCAACDKYINCDSLKKHLKNAHKMSENTYYSRLRSGILKSGVKTKSDGMVFKTRQDKDFRIASIKIKLEQAESLYRIATGATRMRWFKDVKQCRVDLKEAEAALIGGR